jgi:Rrf2 family protein
MRLEITRKSDLAVRALGALATGRRLKGSHLAEITGTSASFMAQVMAPLVQAGWVHSDPGPTGGYEIAAELAELSVLEVIEAVEGPTDGGRCVLRGGSCPGPGEEHCALHDAWVPARAALMERLAATAMSTYGGGR